MKVKTVKRYYCEFCGKGGQSASHMSRHERGCTLNPNRVCGFCNEVGEDQKTMPELMAIMAKAEINVVTDDIVEGFRWTSSTLTNEKEILKALEDATGNCPACMLATIRQSGHAELFENFNFKDRQIDFWSCVNDARTDRYSYC
jgi:hypothetical protein